MIAISELRTGDLAHRLLSVPQQVGAADRDADDVSLLSSIPPQAELAGGQAHGEPAIATAGSAAQAAEWHRCTSTTSRERGSEAACERSKNYG